GREPIVLKITGSKSSSKVITIFNRKFADQLEWAMEELAAGCGEAIRPAKKNPDGAGARLAENSKVKFRGGRADGQIPESIPIEITPCKRSAKVRNILWHVRLNVGTEEDNAVQPI